MNGKKTQHGETTHWTFNPAWKGAGNNVGWLVLRCDFCGANKNYAKIFFSWDPPGKEHSFGVLIFGYHNIQQPALYREWAFLCQNMFPVTYCLRRVSGNDIIKHKIIFNREMIPWTKQEAEHEYTPMRGAKWGRGEKTGRQTAIGDGYIGNNASWRLTRLSEARIVPWHMQ